MTLKDSQKQTHNEYGTDLTLLAAKLKLTPTQRVEEFIKFMELIEELRKAKPKAPNSNDDQLQRSPQTHT